MSKRSIDATDADETRIANPSLRECPVVFVAPGDQDIRKWLVPFDRVPTPFANLLLSGVPLNSRSQNIRAHSKCGRNYLRTLQSDPDALPSAEEAIGLCLIRLGIERCLKCKERCVRECEHIDSEHPLGNTRIKKLPTTPVVVVELVDEV